VRRPEREWLLKVRAGRFSCEDLLKETEDKIRIVDKLFKMPELRRIEAFVSDQFGWKVIFDESVLNIVYAEGVFPAQGTRPFSRYGKKYN
jgi:hypothetical protein